jgi:hypothetical protein
MSRLPSKVGRMGIAAVAMGLLILGAGTTRGDDRESEIRNALSEETSLTFEDAPLSEVIAFIRATHRLPVVTDERSLADAGIALDTPVTTDLSRISLESALDLMLDELELTWIVRNGVLTITTRSDAFSTFTTVVYPVDDLVVRTPADVAVDPSARLIAGDLLSDGSAMGSVDAVFDEDDLVDLITQVVEPASWAEVGGPGSIQAVPGGLVVSQSRSEHEQIASLVDDLRRLKAGEPPVYPKRERERLILDALSEETSLTFNDTPLTEVAAFVEVTHRVPVVLDRRSFDDAGLALDVPVTVDYSGMPLADALELILGTVELSYVVDREVLFITTQERAKRRHGARVYSTQGVHSELLGEKLRLVNIIRMTTEPTSWEGVGGPGCIETVPGGLVVSSRDDVHQEVDRLLKNLVDLQAARSEHQAPPEGDSKQAAELEAQRRLLVRSYTVAGFQIDDVKELITSMVSPGSWSEGRPDGWRIRILRPAENSPSGMLVIRQSEEVHRSIEALLEGLKVIQKPEEAKKPAGTGTF